MLFNSYQFVLVFLPVVWAVYWLLCRWRSYRGAIGWLIVGSLVFYGWWNPVYVALIFVSIVFNFAVGFRLKKNALRESSTNRKTILVFGVAVNLAALGYFKYANFLLETANMALDTSFHLGEIVLPLAISFFTFQQITYLVDTYKGVTEEHSFLHYCLFVTFFPQLIAGPIVHHKEMLPQFRANSTYRLTHRNVAIGSSIFLIGLVKKVGIADNIASYSTPVFDAALRGETMTFFEAWGGALAYTFQLYFDFSGYSDMAVGLAYLFGICLPLNFFSPYKATNIIDFWRRWHITLSRFLRDYIYIPLGGNRKGLTRRYENLLITMLLGGLWHGAAWTFVFWGALHGIYLVVNNAWRALRLRLGQDLTRTTLPGRVCGRLITFLAVVVGWVFFRAESFPASIGLLKGMAGMNGFLLPSTYREYLNAWSGLGDRLADLGVRFERTVTYFWGVEQVLFTGVLLFAIWGLPNTHRLMGAYSPALDITHASLSAVRDPIIQWKPSVAWALFIIAIGWWAVFGMDRTSEFLYYQF